MTKDSVGPVNSDGQLRASHEFSKFSRSDRSYCRRLLLNGRQWIACLLQFSSFKFSNNGPWNVQQFLMWILSQWTATSLLLLAYNQTQRRILSIFHVLHLPQNWTLEWWSQNVANKCGVYPMIFDLGTLTLEVQKLSFSYVSNLVHVNTDNMFCSSWPSLNQLSNSGTDETITTNFVSYPSIFNVGTLKIARVLNKHSNKHCGLFTTGLGSILC